MNLLNQQAQREITLALEYLRSEDGRKKIRENLTKSLEVIAELRQVAKPDSQSLYEPMTI